MAFNEYRGNMHCHTPYSDGAEYHADVAQAAIRAGLDFLIMTDHNVWVDGLEGYILDERPMPPPTPRRIGYPEPPPQKQARLLLLIGEEVHDVRRDPQVNHCLVYGAEREMAPCAPVPQRLIDEVRASGGLAFLAHPIEKAALAIGEDAINWVDWEVQNYTGLEIWNYMSEFKALMRYPALGARYILDPESGIRGPFAAVLAKWDALLREGNKIVGIGNSDAHGTRYHLGPITRTIFPYEDLFRAVNTHVLTKHALTGNVAADKAEIYQALGAGHCWVGYDQIAPTTGFVFSASGWRAEGIMGDDIPLVNSVTLQVHVPQMAHIRLIRYGEVVAELEYGTNLMLIAAQPGAYRAEVYLTHRGQERGWIFSNPIYVRESTKKKF